MDDSAYADGFTSLRLLRTMFTEYRLFGWHIVSSNLSNQRLIVDFKFHTGRLRRDQQPSLGPSTLFCMQIVKQLYMYLRIRQWTIVSGDRESEIIHFSFTFEFKKDVTRLPSSCLRSVLDKNRYARGYRFSSRDRGDSSREGDETMIQLMNIMRDLEQLDSSGDGRGSKSFFKSSTSAAATEKTDGGRGSGDDSLLLTTPPMRRSNWFNENESESDANDQRIQEELANWRMGVCLQSPPYGGCSSSASSSNSYRSRSAIRRPVPRKPLRSEPSAGFNPIRPTNQESRLSLPKSTLGVNINESKCGPSRSKSAATPARYGSGKLVKNGGDLVEPCFLRKPIVGEGELVGRRNDSGFVASANSSSKADSDGGLNEPGASSFSSCSIGQYSSDETRRDTNEISDQCSMCKRKIDPFDQRCENCLRRYCAECVWWCVLAKRQRCLMCYSAKS